MNKTLVIFAARDKEGETAALMNKFLERMDGYDLYNCSDGGSLNNIISYSNIIIFTPTYWFGIPSRLQSIIEDLTFLEEIKYDFLNGRKFACVAYSPHGGDTECITKLGLIFNSWGCEIVPCGLMYFRSILNFEKDHWNFEDIYELAAKFK